MISILGGILLIAGAFFTMTGNVYRAVMFYLIADVCWIGLAYFNGNIIGLILIIIGTIMGAIAFVKMHFSFMAKSLEKL